MTPLNDHDPCVRSPSQEIRERAAELGERRGLPEEVVHQVLDSVTEPGQLRRPRRGYIELPVAEKQGLLETLSVEERCVASSSTCNARSVSWKLRRRSSRRYRKSWENASARCTCVSS
jgi:hypothetical protein